MRGPAAVVVVVALLYPPFAAAMTLDELLASSARHYPSIDKARAGVEAQEGKVQAARGAFDWELSGKSEGRTGGFYDSRYTEGRITRRLSGSAVRVHGGYRASGGRFPIYEDENVTLSGGEFNAGLSLSLWRDRVIDEDRFRFSDSELELRQRRLDLLLTRVAVQYDAMQAYLAWVAAGAALEVSEDLLTLADQRQGAFEERVRRGDLAQISLTENRQFIAKRTADVNDARRRLTNSAVRLGLFWRDEAGDPVTPDRADLPVGFPQCPVVGIDLAEAIGRARSLRPELARLDTDRQREGNRKLLGENQLLPKVDLRVEAARDAGDASTPSQRQRAGTEGKVGVTVSIPLQRNTGEGLVRQAERTIRQLEQDSRLLADRIAADIRVAANNYQVARENVGLAETEVRAAEAMEAAERERFAGGAADLFVLNLREERSGDARLKRVEARLKLWSAVADYYLATLRTDELRVRD